MISGTNEFEHTTSPLILITPPPTPNGRLHIGHVAGPFLRADLLKRLLHFVGSREVVHISHVDSYQSYVAKKARELNRDVVEFRIEMTTGIRADFDSFGILFDEFIDNTSDEYLKFLESAIQCMTSILQPRNRKVRFCEDCNSTLFESHVKGFCRCCFHDCYQNVCENCCQPQSPETLLFPSCCVCGSNSFKEDDTRTESWLQIIAEEIDEVADYIRPFYEQNRRLKTLFENLSPHEIGLTYSSNYGVFPKALDGALNAWVEIYFGHFYAILKHLKIDTSKGFEEALISFKKFSLKPQIVYFFGVDNTYYYTFLFTWLSIRLNIHELIPKNVFVNFFLELNNAKISSSRNNLIWARDLRVTGNLGELRRNLALSCPEFAPRNFQSFNPSVSNFDMSLSKKILLEASSEPFKLLREKIKVLADPFAFSVESLMDTISKWRGFVISMKATGSQLSAANEIEAYLSELETALELQSS